jgi:hypothetical protein
MTAVTKPQPKGINFKNFLTIRPTRPYWHPYLGGLLLGIVLFLAFFLTGNGLGASGGLNRIIVFVEDLIVPGHVDRTPYLLKMAGGDKNPLDDWIIPAVFGTLAGGFVSGWRNGRLKWETNKGPQITNRQRWFFAFLGGGIMGYGRAHGARLHLRPGALRRGGAVGGLVGIHVRRVCRGVCAGLLRAQVVEVKGGQDAISTSA